MSSPALAPETGWLGPLAVNELGGIESGDGGECPGASCVPARNLDEQCVAGSMRIGTHA